MQTHRTDQGVTVLNDMAEIPGLGFLPVNAFVIHAEPPVVIDTGLSNDDKDFVSGLSGTIDPAGVRWIWLTHPDRDHTGGAVRPARGGATSPCGHDLHRRRHPKHRAAVADGPGLLAQPRPTARRRRPDAVGSATALVRQPGNRRRGRPQDPCAVLVRLLRLTSADEGGGPRGRRARREPGRPAGRTAAVGRRRQPVGSQRGRGEVPGEHRPDPLPRPVDDLQHAPSDRARTQPDTARDAARSARLPTLHRPGPGPLEAMLAQFEPETPVPARR